MREGAVGAVPRNLGDAEYPGEGLPSELVGPGSRLRGRTLRGLGRCGARKKRVFPVRTGHLRRDSVPRGVEHGFDEAIQLFEQSVHAGGDPQALELGVIDGHRQNPVPIPKPIGQLG